MRERARRRYPAGDTVEGGSYAREAEEGQPVGSKTRRRAWGREGRVSRQEWSTALNGGHATGVPSESGNVSPSLTGYDLELHFSHL